MPIPPPRIPASRCARTRRKPALHARVRKNWAGLKEMLTPSDHYAVEFTGLVSQPTRTLTVMMPIVLDLTLYGPD
jgi:hypothetical protein